MPASALTSRLSARAVTAAPAEHRLSAGAVTAFQQSIGLQQSIGDRSRRGTQTWCARDWWGWRGTARLPGMAYFTAQLGPPRF